MNRNPPQLTCENGKTETQKPTITHPSNSMVQTVCHEIMNPTAIIKGHADYLLHLIEIIKSENSKNLNLLKQLQTLAEKIDRIMIASEKIGDAVNSWKKSI